MRFSELIALIDEVECKPFEFEIVCIQCSEQPNWIGCVAFTHTWFVRAMLWRQDTHTGDWGWGAGGRYLIDDKMSTGEAVKKMFVAARDYAEHEVREAFHWRGRRILGPHIDLNVLWGVADQEENHE